MKLIIGSDVNAHHTLWGSTNVNNRGETLLEYILSTNLIILNRGNTPTYKNVTRGEVLDMTLATLNICDKILDWKVEDWDFGSDHIPITFRLDHKFSEMTDEYRNVKQTNWNDYRLNLQTKLTTLTDTDDLNKCRMN